MPRRKADPKNEVKAGETTPADTTEKPATDVTAVSIPHLNITVGIKTY